MKAIELGLISTGPEVGYQQCLDVCPLLAEACNDITYNKRFQTWWCKYKKKVNAKRALENLPAEQTQPAANPPVPPSTDDPDWNPSPSDNPFPEKKRPPAKKGPKKPVQNQPRPAPAPSPVPTTEKFDFSNVDWDTVVQVEEVDRTKEYEEQEAAYNELFRSSTPVAATKPKSPAKKPPTPVAATKPKSPAKKPPTPVAAPKKPPTPVAAKPKSPAKNNPSSPDTMTSNTDRALNLLNEQTAPPPEFSLDDPNCGIEWYKVPFPVGDTLVMQYFIHGASEPRIETIGDEKFIEVEFPRGSFPYLTQAMQHHPDFQERMTNPAVNKTFKKEFGPMVGSFTNQGLYRRTVSSMSFSVYFYESTCH